jgi:hypothetical protein
MANVPAVKELKLSMEQVAGIAYEAFNSIGTALTLGKIDELTATATAIAWAESSGNALAHNTNSATGDDSYGLWQINMIGGMGPRRRALFGISSNDKLFDPRTNASAMLKLWMNKGRQFTDWSTYKNGAYKKHLDAARTAVKNRKGFAEGQGEVVTTNFVTEALDAMFATVFGFIREIGLRTAGFIGGAALLIGAIVLVAKKGVK